MKKSLSVVALGLGLGLTGVASATSTWNLVSGSGCTQNAGNSGNYGNTWACTGVGDAGTSATASAWSNDRGTGGTAQAGGGWANAYMSPQGGDGFGTASRTEVIGTGSPNHSIDNISPGTYDFVMVQFTSAVILDQFRIGWGAADSDITVMRWNGAGVPTGGTGAVSTGSNATLSNTISSSGWQLVNSWANVCKDSGGGSLTDAAGNDCASSTSTVSTGATVGSSYWLVSAYNTTMDAASGLSTGNDGFKLNFLRTAGYSCPGGGTPGPGGGCSGGGSAPEPGSFALLAMAAFGAGVVRRRGQARC